MKTPSLRTGSDDEINGNEKMQTSRDVACSQTLYFLFKVRLPLKRVSSK